MSILMPDGTRIGLPVPPLSKEDQSRLDYLIRARELYENGEPPVYDKSSFLSKVRHKRWELEKMAIDQEIKQVRGDWLPGFVRAAKHQKRIKTGLIAAIKEVLSDNWRGRGRHDSGGHQ